MYSSTYLEWYYYYCFTCCRFCYCCFTFCEFFTPVLTFFLLKSEWLQVSSSLRNCCQNSNWTKQFCRFNDIYYQFVLTFSQVLVESFKCTNCNWYHRPLNVSQFILGLWQLLSIDLSFYFILFALCTLLEHKNTLKI